MLDRIKAFFVKLLIPSNWLEWLKGKKRLLGVISFALWAVIYGVPAVAPEWAWLSEFGLNAQVFLTSMGIKLNDSLLATGSGLTIIGVLDWLLDHKPTGVATKVIKAAEKPLTPDAA